MLPLYQGRYNKTPDIFERASNRLLECQILASLPLSFAAAIILAPNIWAHVTLIYSIHSLYSSHTALSEGYQVLAPMEQTPYSWPLDGRLHPDPSANSRHGNPKPHNDPNRLEAARAVFAQKTPKNWVPITCGGGMLGK